MLILLDVWFWVGVVSVALALAAVMFSLARVRGWARRNRHQTTWLMDDELEE